MTIKLADYGITGPWMKEVCDTCGKERSCVVANDPQSEESYAFCLMCLVKDIEVAERGVHA
jgi:hypothetical protein